MEDLTPLLMNCQDPNNKNRKLSEDALKLLRKQDPTSFVLGLCKILVDESKPAYARFLSSILFKNTIGSNDPIIKNLWLTNITDVQRKNIKELILTCLGSGIKEVRKGAAQAVAAIAKIELPKKSWPLLLSVLTQAAQNPQLEFRLTSLETLDYITEDIIDASILTPEQIDAILGAIILNINSCSNNDVRLKAISCMCNTIKFCGKNFSSPNESKVIMETIFKCSEVDDFDIKKKCIQAIIEVIRVFYDYLANFMPMIWNISSTIINSKDDTIATQTIEIWCSICDEEINRLKEQNYPNPRKVLNIIKNCYLNLIPQLLKNMCRPVDRSTKEWCLQMASGCCLSLITIIVGDGVVDPVVQFISMNITNPDHSSRDASILAFASIIKGPSKQKLDNLVKSSLIGILKMLNDPNMQVRETTLFALEKIVEHCPELMLSPNNFPEFLKCIFEKLKDNIKVASKACRMFMVIAKVTTANTLYSQVVGQNFNLIIGALIEALKRPDAFDLNCNMVLASSKALGDIARSSPDSCNTDVVALSNQLCMLIDSVMAPNFANKAKVNDYLYLLAGTLYQCILKGSYKDEFLVKIFQLIIKSFQYRSCIYDEGLLVITGIANAMGTKFDQFMAPLGSYIMFGIKNKTEQNIARLTLFLLGEICRAIDSQMGKYVVELMPILFDELKHPDADKRAKLMIISLFGDMAMHCYEVFDPYFPACLECIKMAATYAASDHSDQADDEDMMQYFNELKIAILDTYSGVLFGIKSNQKKQLLDSSYIDFMLAFIKSCYTPDIKEDIASYILGVLGDLMMLYPMKIKEKINGELYLKNILAKLKLSANINIEKNVAFFNTLMENQ